MIKFLAFTDLHYDYATQGDERIRQIIDRVKTGKVDFIVSLGDITAPFEEYDHVLKKVNSAGIPVYHVLGNHDVKVDLQKTMDFLGLEKPYYSFVRGNVKFLILNSCYYRQGNEEHSFPEVKGEGVDSPIIPKEEIEWLKKELEEDKDYVIFSHHSFTNPFRNRAVRTVRCLQHRLQRARMFERHPIPHIGQFTVAYSPLVRFVIRHGNPY